MALERHTSWGTVKLKDLEVYMVFWTEHSRPTNYICCVVFAAQYLFPLQGKFVSRWDMRLKLEVMLCSSGDRFSLFAIAIRHRYSL